MRSARRSIELWNGWRWRSNQHYKYDFEAINAVDKMNVGIVAGECNHVAVNTGVANVVRDLARALSHHPDIQRVHVILPCLGRAEEAVKGSDYVDELEFQQERIKGRLKNDKADDSDGCDLWLVRNPALADVDAKDGLRIRWSDELSYANGKAGEFRNQNMAKAMFQFSKTASEICLEQRVDVVHCLNWEAGLVPRSLQGALPTVLTIDLLTTQGIISPQVIDGHEAGVNMLRDGIKRATLLHYPSQEWRRRAMSGEFACGLDGEQKVRAADSRSVPFAVNANAFSTEAAAAQLRELLNETEGEHLDTASCLKAYVQRWVRSRLGLKHSTGPLFVVANRLSDDDQKNYGTLLKAMESVLRRRPAAQFVIRPLSKPKTVPTRTMFRNCENLVTRIGRDRVVVHPEYRYQDLDGLPWGVLLLAADVNLMPSRFEPAGLNHLQAMAMGCPTVGTSRGGMCEHIRNASNGWRYDTPSSVDQLTRCCLAAIDAFDYGAWPAIVERARKTAIRWSWECAVDDYVQLYREAMDAPASD